METTNVSVVNTVINPESKVMETLSISYNGIECTTSEEKTHAVRLHLRRGILKRFGFKLKDADGKALKSELCLNGKEVSVSFPAVSKDAVGNFIENIEGYYNRNRLKLRIAYGNTFVAISRYEFIEKVD